MSPTWRRLEGGVVDPEMTEGLSARIADPLWTLARQWQVGEFRGEDAASPILVRAEVETIPINGLRIGKTTVDVSPFLPLEALVEAEDVRRGPAALRHRVESAAALIRQLRAADIPEAVAALRSKYPLSPTVFATLDDLDPVGAARLRMLGARGFDAAALARAWRDAGGSAGDLDVVRATPSAVRDAMALTIDDWSTTEIDLFEEPRGDGAWLADRLEYRFGLRAEGARSVVHLQAAEYRGGTLDWFDFDVAGMKTDRDRKEGRKPGSRPDRGGKGDETDPRRAQDVGGDGKPTSTSVEVLASPLQYAGQPASRFWEFEDGDVSYGDLAGGPEDLARSVIGAYAAVAGDDWLMVPVTLPVGSLARVKSLHVVDNFGGRLKISSTAQLDARAAAAGTGPKDRPWRFFELTGDIADADVDALAPMLFLPPVMDTVEQGRPLEAVEFRRDEMANLAWAIERRVEGPWGHAVDRDARIGPPQPRPDELWDYTFMTTVPESWVPLVPVNRKGRFPQMVLRRGAVAHSRGASPATVPRSVLMNVDGAFILQEEEIPNGGLRVTRRFQMARDHNGGVHVWVGRKKNPSGGPMRRTPLKFDRLRYEPRGDIPPS